MKKSSEVQGLPIISIADGVEIGRVKSLIINPEKRSIDFITVDHEEWQMEGRAVPFNKIVGIGDYALTIDSKRSVIDMNEIPVANELLNRKISILQTKIMTRKGQLVGEATEYSIDDETGELVQLYVLNENGEYIVAGKDVITYGKELIIVTEGACQQVSADQQQPAPEAAFIVNNQASNTGEKSNSEKKIDEVEPVDEEAADNLSSWLKMIDDQQMKLLKGKKVTKDIVIEHEVIIEEGTVLKEEDIQKAREAGPEVLIEISMNSEA